MARLVSHPNVCRVHDLGEVQGQFFLSMEYIDGEDLASLLRRIGRLPNDKALEIARKLCAGLAAAHEKGILHRDLKPGNVMLDARGQVLLTDFGLSGIAEDLGDVRSGTPAYMSPEQLAGKEVTVRSDIYALGLVLYELFTGKRPFDGNSLAELMAAQQANTPISLTSVARDLDPSVERIIARCLDPTRRGARVRRWRCRRRCLEAIRWRPRWRPAKRHRQRSWRRPAKTRDFISKSPFRWPPPC